MKTLDLLIIISIATGIMVFFGIFVLSNPHVASNDIKLHGLPTSPGIKLSFNGSDFDHYPFNQFETRQGQNITLVVDVTSDPQNLPVTLYIEPHIGFTKTNGLGLKLSSTHIDTPGTVLLYISSSKDATPNKYKMGVWAGTNTIEQGSLSMRTDIGIIVKHQNDLK